MGEDGVRGWRGVKVGVRGRREEAPPVLLLFRAEDMGEERGDEGGEETEERGERQ